MKLKFGLSAFFLLLSAFGVFAQSKPFGGGTIYTVSGNVRANGADLAGAAVVLIFDSNIVGSATTDANGNYSLNAIEGFSYAVSVYKEGYNFNPSYQNITNVQSNQIVNFQNGVRLCVPAPFGQTGENFCQNAVPTNVSSIENGRIAYEIFGSAFAVNADGTNQAQLPPGGAFPSWSPDGTRVLYNRDPSNDIGFDQEIFLMNADGSGNMQLTANDWSEFRARFSPDGTRIIFERLVNSSDRGIYVRNADNSNEIRLTPIEVIAMDASFSPDGTKIVYTDGIEIFVMNADGTNPTQLTFSGVNFQSIEPSWSPDNLHIVFASNRLDFGFEIWRMTAQGTSPIQLTSEADLSHRTPVYSPDGTKIAFSRNTSAIGFREIYSQPIFNGSAQRLTFTFQQSNAENPSWQRTVGTVGITPSSGVNLTFSNVTTAGNTVATPITPASAGALPSGYGLIPEPSAFDIRTSAQFAENVEVCFNISGVNDENRFNDLVVFHNEQGILIDRTSSHNFAERKICALVSSLSPFVLAAPLVPLAAHVSASGRVLTNEGLSLRNAVVVMTDSAGISRSVRTNAFGYFRFDDVEAGQTYIFEIRAKRFPFATQILTITEEIADLEFVALE